MLHALQDKGLASTFHITVIQQLVNKVLAGTVDGEWNGMIFCNTWVHHLLHLLEVFCWMQNVGRTITSLKCLVARGQVEYLCNILSDRTRESNLFFFFFFLLCWYQVSSITLLLKLTQRPRERKHVSQCSKNANVVSLLHTCKYLCVCTQKCHVCLF